MNKKTWFFRLTICMFLTGIVSFYTFAQARLNFSELYNFGVLGMTYTDKVQDLKGKTVSFVGYMAPPLKARSNFFVLTREPVSLCPFCNSDADWPADIIVVYLKQTETFSQKNKPLLVSGTLEIGSYTDPSTGFVSQLRLVNAEYREN